MEKNKMQIIINSSNQIKETKKSINYVCGKISIVKYVPTYAGRSCTIY
ncbi:hypothetical protein [Plasmodium yoelii yoelii]|uniref:Uncharacterized protein n=1 Tax=Plasmodium yoelii yoelii TaxID=73239 RepID=Q7RAJ0_PLAYO|nr:hypothetical protein [Plasmodium yoelii yoelii]